MLDIKLTKLMSKGELEGLFSSYTDDDLREFLKYNRIPFNGNMRRKNLLEHTIIQCLSYSIYYKMIGD